MDVTCCVCSEPSTEGSTQSVSTLSTELLSEVANHCTLPRVCTSCLNTVTNICSLKRSLKRKNRPSTPVTGGSEHERVTESPSSSGLLQSPQNEPITSQHSKHHNIQDQRSPAPSVSTTQPTVSPVSSGPASSVSGIPPISQHTHSAEPSYSVPCTFTVKPLALAAAIENRKHDIQCEITENRENRNHIVRLVANVPEGFEIKNISVNLRRKDEVKDGSSELSTEQKSGDIRRLKRPDSLTLEKTIERSPPNVVEIVPRSDSITSEDAMSPQITSPQITSPQITSPAVIGHIQIESKKVLKHALKEPKDEITRKRLKKETKAQRSPMTPKTLTPTTHKSVTPLAGKSVTPEGVEDENMWSCHLCLKWNRNQRALESHMEREHVECEICKVWLISAAGYQRHKASIHSSTASPRVPEFKMADFALLLPMTSVGQTMPGQNLPGTSSAGTTLPVPAQSPGSSAIDMSVRSSSSTSTELQSDYKCMLCNESFYSESYLQQHIVQCNGSNSRPGMSLKPVQNVAGYGVCQWCKRPFPTDHGLRVHMKQCPERKRKCLPHHHQGEDEKQRATQDVWRRGDEERYRTAGTRSILPKPSSKNTSPSPSPS